MSTMFNLRSVLLGAAFGAALVVAPAVIAAGGPGMGGPGMGASGGRERFEEAAQAAGLSEAQRDQIEALWMGHMEAQIDGRAEIEKGRLAMRRALESEVVDEKAAWKTFEQLMAAEKAMGEDRLQTMLSIRKLMTADQWKIVSEAYRERRGPPGGPGMEGGPGGK